MRKNHIQERPLRTGLIITAMVFLLNANITVVDPLPDFIGYFMLIGALSFAAKRVPYLEEVRTGFLRLAILSLARIPAFLLVIKIRGLNTTDGDIYALASLVFAVIELILVFGTVKNLFAGISYLGDRTGKKSVIGENPSAEFLRGLTLLFAVVKCVGYSLPEFTRLTSTDDIGTLTTAVGAMRYYPILFVTAQILTYVIGIVWVAYFARYLRRLRASGDYYPAVMSLTDAEKERRIERESRVSGLALGLNLIVPATLLSFDLTFDQLRDVNILPHFLFGILIILSLLKLMTAVTKIHIAALAAGAVYTVYSIFAWIKSIAFYDKYTIFETLLYEDAADAYRSLEIIFWIELGLFCVFLLLFSLALIGFIKMHTGKTPFGITDPFAPNKEKDYTPFDAKYHRGLIAKVWVFFGIGVLLGIVRMLAVIFKDDREFAYGVLAPKIAPWIGIAVVAISVIWCIYTYSLVGTLKEDMRIKYSDPEYNEPEEKI